ncbi:molybdate ABC transporter substrate-binding protein [Photobacterium jeanii]|uniref:Molybdate ABC transporter substrate-binding protein n=1 Tax=Photobacterium jeanii TaxID=858640 RepID=A0A178K317_9GAMM|nr:molybdate ABC transporter substrate-binding protein [Photobacterium jeanii]OAN11700.1 molybdate ABC transporter substrate-binding protein [Photobacterium jeanii]
MKLGKLLALASICVAATVQANDKVTIFAASSLTNAVTDIAKAYEAQADVTTRLSFASSSALARQIAQGAPADIYISANQKWMSYLSEQQAVESDSVTPLLHNSLVVVAPKSYPEPKIHVSAAWDLEKALDGTRLAVGDPKHVPAGRYAKQSLEHYGLWADALHLLARANNVRSALVLVERGESQLGIVYKTDAQISDKVKIVAQLADDSHLPIQYPMAIVADKATPAVKSYYQFLQSDAAKAIFTKYGFEVVSAN